MVDCWSKIVHNLNFLFPIEPNNFLCLPPLTAGCNKMLALHVGMSFSFPYFKVCEHWHIVLFSCTLIINNATQAEECECKTQAPTIKFIMDVNIV